MLFSYITDPAAQGHGEGVKLMNELKLYSIPFK